MKFKEDKLLQEKIVTIIKNKIDERNYDFVHWYDYTFDTDIYVDSDIVKNMNIDDKESIETNYSDFIYSQYEDIMEDVTMELSKEVDFIIIKNNLVDWDNLWSSNFDYCDFLEDEIKKELWIRSPLR